MTLAFFMPWIIRGLMVAGACLMLFGAYRHVVNVGVDEQKAIDAPIIAAQKKAAKDAEDARVVVQADNEKLKGALREELGKMEELQRAEAEATAKAAAEKTRAAADAKRYSAKIAGLEAIAAGPPTPGDTHAKAAAILRDYARCVRDHSPASNCPN